MGGLDCVNNKITESTEVFTINNHISSNTSLDESRRDVESQSKTRRHSLWWNIAIDVPLLIVVLTLLGLYELGVIGSHKAGFFCNDPALSYPFTGDTVSMGVIISTVLFLPVVVILITEAFFVNSEYPMLTKMNTCLRKTLLLYRGYAYGFFFNLVVVEVMKGITGVPRPTFFDLCEPDTAKTCKGNEFVSTFECTSTRFSSWTQKDSYHSFPSGHTSFSVYCGFFIAWYLQRRAFDWRNRTVFLVPVVQMLCIIYATLCSLTRITDHRHHWWDVVAGTAIGVVSLYFAVMVLCKNFSSVRASDCAEEKQGSPLFLDRNER